MRVEIQLDPETARAFRSAAGDDGPGGRTSSAATALRRAARELGISIAPVHPHETHDLLIPYFHTDVPDRATADRVAARLRQLKGVEGAWVRPADELS